MNSIVTERDHEAALRWPMLPLGVGTGQLCSLNGGLSVRGAARLLHSAFDFGVRFIDTAPTYGQGHAEAAIGRLPPNVRNELTLCSKVGYSFGRKMHLINAAKPFVRPILPWVAALQSSIAQARDSMTTSGSMNLVIEPASIRTTLEGSLRRMRRDWLDLLLLHDPSIESVDSSANQQELTQLVRSGKIRGWGVSTSDPVVVHRAIETAGCSVVQFPVYPQWVRENPQLLAACASRNVAVIANRVMAPLANPLDGGDALRQPITAEQCLAFALRQPAVRVVLCGMRSLQHVTHNVESVRKLSRTNGSLGTPGAAAGQSPALSGSGANDGGGRT